MVLTASTLSFWVRPAHCITTSSLTCVALQHRTATKGSSQNLYKSGLLQKHPALLHIEKAENRSHYSLEQLKKMLGKGSRSRYEVMP